MAMNLTEAQINAIVAKVVSEFKSAPAASAPTAKEYDSTQYKGRKLIGVYETMEEAIEVANAGYKAVRSMSVADREKIITAIRNLCRAEAHIMAEIGVA
jgi:acyl-CoA reductase-like NAD-dependent aldehyde dehydrogenase